jgi:hypothetical protein
VGKRHRWIRALGTSGPVAGAATEKHGLAAHRANGLPSLRSPKEPLVPERPKLWLGPDVPVSGTQRRSFMAGKAAVSSDPSFALKAILRQGTVSSLADLTLVAWALVEVGVRAREGVQGKGRTERDRATRVLIVMTLGAAIVAALDARSVAPTLRTLDARSQTGGIRHRRGTPRGGGGRVRPGAGDGSAFLTRRSGECGPSRGGRRSGCQPGDPVREGPIGTAPERASRRAALPIALASAGILLTALLAKAFVPEGA